MARGELVSDDLWAAIAPLLPQEPAKPRSGRTRCSDRDALRGIVFVLRSGIPWEVLPREAFGCSGMTCWRRMRDWQQAEVRGHLHRVLLERLHQAGEIDRSRASIDSASIGPERGGCRNGAKPDGQGQAGDEAPHRHRPVSHGSHRFEIHGERTPLGLIPTGANRHDSMTLAPVLDAVPGVRPGGRGRPRKRPDKLHADKAYDSRRCRMACRARNIMPRIARKRIESSAHLGRHRWVVERTFA